MANFHRENLHTHLNARRGAAQGGETSKLYLERVVADMPLIETDPNSGDLFRYTVEPTASILVPRPLTKSELQARNYPEYQAPGTERQILDLHTEIGAAASENLIALAADVYFSPDLSDERLYMTPLVPDEGVLRPQYDHSRYDGQHVELAITAEAAMDGIAVASEEEVALLMRVPPQLFDARKFRPNL
jgi:hypothetical protein